MTRAGKQKKVAVLMSGGVDSSVTAAMLKKQGYSVTGFFMIFGNQNPDPQKEENKCCSLESQEMARAVANKLKIPFYTVNLIGEFRKKIVDYFVNGYKSGRTPNPCVQCNKFIKFGVMLNRALALGFDYVATGHYVRRESGIRNPTYALRASAGRQESGIRIFVEINPEQVNKIERMIKQYLPCAEIKIKKDLAGLDRIVIIKINKG
ncbi:MAG: tRNA-specific 2-thiouridylase [Parcubacteria group bacterium LiPW_72]|nr:MAG: tRNA-specific 2-thiouridylase [Parcubacteria group bacterium LiPW_72]